MFQHQVQSYLNAFVCASSLSKSIRIIMHVTDRTRMVAQPRSQRSSFFSHCKNRSWHIFAKQIVQWFYDSKGLTCVLATSLVLKKKVAPLFENIPGIALPASMVIWQSRDLLVSETLCCQFHHHLVVLSSVAGRLQDVSEFHWWLLLNEIHMVPEDQWCQGQGLKNWQLFSSLVESLLHVNFSLG